MKENNKKNTKNTNKTAKPTKKNPKADSTKGAKKPSANKVDSKSVKADSKKDVNKGTGTGKDTAIKDVNKKPINKKIVFIVAAVAIIAIVIAAFFVRRTVLRHKAEKNMIVQLYEGTDYPVSFNDDGSTIKYTLDGSKTPNLKWNVIVDRDEFVSAEAEGEEVDGKVTYNVYPLKGGSTDIHFVRSMKVADIEINVVDIKATLYVEENDNFTELTMVGEIEYTKGPDVIAEDTESPVIINNASSDASSDSESAEYDELNGNVSEGDIYFVNGVGDWTFKSADNSVDLSYYSYDKGDIAYIEKGMGVVMEENPESGDLPGKEERLGKAKVSEDATPEGQSVEDKEPSPATDITGGDFTLTNEKLGVTEKFHVEFTDNGVVITKVENSKEEQ